MNRSISNYPASAVDLPGQQEQFERVNEIADLAQRGEYDYPDDLEDLEEED